MFGRKKRRTGRNCRTDPVRGRFAGTFAVWDQLAIHKLAASLRHATTLLVWRSDARAANVAAFAEVMLSSIRPNSPARHVR